ncbi:MAG TPA: lipopolysaccharide transport periplasmic protein LptA [Burkholderiales bacterium]|nr:lipopolysaccharide transport periplasmic protein LptA [Burkholderiales bacterium]
MPVYFPHRLLAAFLLAVLPLQGAWAERADRNQPINIESDRLTADENKQVAIFEGRVILTQGSFVLRADRLIVRQDDTGFEHATAYGAPATFRERREGTNEWIDGEALRIEYDGRKEFVELFDKARLTREKDEVRGSYISYDARSDFFTVKSKPGEAPQEGGDARVRAVIQPKSKEPPPASPPAQLQPSERLGGGAP